MKSLKLNVLEQKQLENQELNALQGGGIAVWTDGRYCFCGCYYVDNGGSSTNDNGKANYAIGDKGGNSIKPSVETSL